MLSCCTTAKGRSISLTRQTVIRVAIVVVVIAAIAIAIIDIPRNIPRHAGTAPGGVAAPPPPPPWTAPQRAALQEAIRGADAEGLRSEDYRVTAQDDDARATGQALALAHDYAAGRIRNRARFGWHVDHPAPSPAELAAALIAARGEDRLGAWLASLLPGAAPYAALRTALADATPGAERNRIRANMERWRWLPRDYGAAPDRLLVNLPTYRLDVIRGGATRASYRVVIGAPETRTPTLSATVARVIVNPSWIVPPSIVRSSHIRPGGAYAFTALPNGQVRVRRRPGAGNSLGKVKIEMPNSMAIYLHDTPAKALFERDARAFSHGCVRVQHVDALAASLLDDGPRFAAAYAGGTTRSFPVTHPWPVDIVYLTLDTKPGEAPVALGDPYGLDAPMAAALDGKRVKLAEPKIVAQP